jgi:folate-dependent phosphoribosylglycinamide formyltransferase PurN
MYAVREVSLEQFYEKNSKLKHYQKVWLIQSETYKKEREKDDAWLEKLLKEIARWIVSVGYKKVIGNKEYIKFGKAEYIHILALLENYKEDFR